MFHKIRSFIHEAVEALAPDVPLQETFVFHWKAITNYFIEATDEKVPVQSTNIPYHLEQMLDILRHEEDDQNGGATGPCLEYLLQHKILDTLHTLGRADCPPGMKQQVLLFFANLLAKMKQPLLPHISVYRPVHRLIRLCGEVKAAPSENEEIQFLCVVCAKLRQDPYLVNFFLESLGTSPSGTHSPLEELHPPPVKAQGRDKPDYTLVNSLLNLSKSEDSRIAVKACEGLLLCASLPEDHAATVIILYTPFCEVMSDRLKVLFEHLPQNMEPIDISAIAAKWGLDHQSDDEDVLSFPGKRQLISFLSWLDYVDQLSKEAHKLVAKALAVGVRERFLQPVIEPGLFQQSELGVITITALLRRCIQAVTSPQLLQEMCIFLLGEGTTPEVPTHVGDHKLRQTLIQRCDHLSDEISIETLKLFETLLNKPCDVILNNLVLRNLKSRKYYTTPPVPNGDTSAASNGPAVADKLAPPSPHTGFPPSPTSPSTPPLTPDGLGSPQIVENVDRDEVEQVVNSFISLVPDEIKTSALTGDTGYDTYLRDAHRQCNQRAIQTSTFEWPSTPVPPSDFEDSREVFYEGAFLNMLFKKLQRLLDQPYDVNLQVTSVIAQLSQFKHPQLQEFLLNASLPLAPDCRSLHSTLQNVVQDLKGRIQRLPNFQRNVVSVRRQLMGIATSPEHKSLSESNLLEAAIVLEEFCKELAAIAFVKATERVQGR
ncbi:FHF complex subunit HOOK interacting protein 2A-like isoform X1 [Porites lutea]|uniref:FHF complex subunit HOOK interacting protein 2A-like isoform X1 n=2 Tax=Porites lutea TaxID=51062 RepID=UPI003CC5F56F